METSVNFECVATFRNNANLKKRILYQAGPLKTAYLEGLAAFEKKFGESADSAGFELADISVRDAREQPHQWSWFEEYDVDSHLEGRIDGCALNAYTLEQLKNPELIP